MLVRLDLCCYHVIYKMSQFSCIPIYTICCMAGLFTNKSTNKDDAINFTLCSLNNHNYGYFNHSTTG